MTNESTYLAPKTGSWDGGRFYSSIPRRDGFSSGVVILRDVGGHELAAQNAAIEAASTQAELLAIRGAMTFGDYIARTR